MTMNDEMEMTFALNGLIYICVTLVCIGFSWWALQQFRFDLFLKFPKSPQAKALQIVISIAIGYQLARFMIEYFQWSTLLKGLFS